MTSDYISLCIEFDKLSTRDFYGIATEKELDRLTQVEYLLRSIESENSLEEYRGTSFVLN